MFEKSKKIKELDKRIVDLASKVAKNNDEISELKTVISMLKILKNEIDSIDKNLTKLKSKQDAIFEALLAVVRTDPAVDENDQ